MCIRDRSKPVKTWVLSEDADFGATLGDSFAKETVCEKLEETTSMLRRRIQSSIMSRIQRIAAARVNSMECWVATMIATAARVVMIR